VVGFKQPLNTLNQIHALVPPFAEYETGFIHWLKILKNLTSQTNSKLKFIVERNSVDNFTIAIERCKLKLTYTIEAVNQWDDFFRNGTNGIAPHDDALLFILSARKGSISYSPKLESIPKHISRRFKSRSFVIVYPSQVKLTSVDLRSFLTGSGQLAVDENPTILSKVK